MTWGRSSTTVAATKGGRSTDQTKFESRSGRSTPVQGFNPAVEPFPQPSSSRAGRSRSHSFSLPFFNAQRAAAKQEALQRKAAAAAQVAVVTTTMKTSSEIDEHADSGKERLPSRFFARTQSNRSAASPDLSSGRPSFNTPRTSSTFKDGRRRQQQARADDDEFSCCGLEASMPSADAQDAVHSRLPLEFTSRTSSRLAGAQHKNALSVSSTASSTASSNQSTASMVGDTTGSSGSGTSQVAIGSGFNTDTIGWRRGRVGEMGDLTATQKDLAEDPYLSMTNDLGDIDSMDVADLLDQTLMPMIMSPTVLHRDHLIDTASLDVRLRQARSMPMLRAAKLQQQQQQQSAASPALPLPSFEASSMNLPYPGDTNGLRLQLGPALPQVQLGINENRIQRPVNAGTSPLRIRRKKAPLTIDANVRHQDASLPFFDENKAESEQAPLSASSIQTSSTLTEPSPRTPLQALPASRVQMPRARRSSSNRTLKSSFALASPPPCPPPTTPLPDIPTFEQAALGGAGVRRRVSCSTEMSTTTNTTTTTPSTSFVSAKADSRRQSTLSKSSASSILPATVALVSTPPALSSMINAHTAAVMESPHEPKLDESDLAGFGFAF